MILAQALLRINGHENEPAILQLFNDSPAPSHPFSLHHLVDQGQRLGKGPGHWFGSASIAHALASLVDAAKESQLVDLSVPAVCVVADSCIYRDRVMAMAAGGRGDWDQAVVLLLPLRLGLDSLTASYVPILNSLFESPFCLGRFKQGALLCRMLPRQLCAPVPRSTYHAASYGQQCGSIQLPLQRSELHEDC